MQNWVKLSFCSVSIVSEKTLLHTGEILRIAELDTLVHFLLMRLWVFCVVDKLFSRKCLVIISFFTHKHTHRQTADTGRRLCVSDGGESSNSAMSFSPLLSCGDLKEVSDWEKPLCCFLFSD